MKKLVDVLIWASVVVLLVAAVLTSTEVSLPQLLESSMGGSCNPAS